MKGNIDELFELTEQAKKASLPKFSEKIQSSKGLNKTIRNTMFKLTSWIIEPVMAYFNKQIEVNTQFFEHIKDLEKTVTEQNVKMEAYKFELSNTITSHKAEFDFFKNRALSDYNQWIVQNEPTEYDVKCQKGHRFAENPTISLVLTIKDSQAECAEELLHSIIMQSYKNWKLYIITDSRAKETMISEKHCADERVIFCNNDNSKSNEALLEFTLSKTQGDYVCFLNAYDTLAPFTLYEIVKTVNENPSVELIYGDEDSVNDSKRYDPVYKPDLAPDTLRSTNYIGHFYAIKFNRLGQVKESMEYTGDLHYEILLHTLEQGGEFYHKRMIFNHLRAYDEVQQNNQNSSSDYLAKKGISESVLKEHITRTLGLTATVKYVNIDDIYRVDYEVIGNPKVSLLIPNKDHLELLKPCVESIQKLTTFDNYEIIVIENNSKDEETFVYYKELEKESNIRIIKYPEERFNYQKIINFGVRSSTAEFIVQLNNDIEIITPNWLELLIGFAQRKEIGAVGVKLYYPDMSIQHAGGILTGDSSISDHIFRFMPKYAQSYKNRDKLIQNVSWVTGACVMCRREIYEEIGFMTEDYEKSFGDLDFCMKIKSSGKAIIYNPFVEMFHYEGKTRGKGDTPQEVAEFIEEREIFNNRWKDVLCNGDTYNLPGMDKIVL